MGHRNVKPATKFKTDITKLLNSSNKAWLKIADYISEASDQLGKAEMDGLFKDVRFSYSKGRKLIKIAKSQRIQQYRTQLGLIDSWSTLHEITKLSDSEFTEFKNQYLSKKKPQLFQRSNVISFKSTQPAPKKPNTVIAKLHFVQNAQATKTEFNEIIKAINKLTVAHGVQVEWGGLYNDLKDKLDNSNNGIVGSRTPHTVKIKKNAQAIKKGISL
tara:strand:+ start:1376 stop:2023 length:648 start_codon:yes stop_codon:yes gene_type:complete